MAGNQNKQIVWEMVENMNRGDLDAAVARVAPDYYVNGHPAGRDGCKQHAAQVAAAIPDGQYIIRSLVDEGPRVVLHWEFCGTAAGRGPVKVSGTSVYRIEGGALVEAWQHCQTPPALELLHLDLSVP